MITYVSRNCDCCGKEYNVRPIDLQRGWGKHCSKSCSQTSKFNATHWTILYPRLVEKYSNFVVLPIEPPNNYGDTIEAKCLKHGYFKTNIRSLKNNDEACSKCAYDKRRQKIIDGKKQCTKCGQQKEVEHFYVLKSKDRLSEQCKECSRERGKTANRDAEKRKASGNKYARKKRIEEILDKNLSSPISISKCEHCSKVISKKGAKPKRFCSAECGKSHRAYILKGKVHKPHKPYKRYILTDKECQCKRCGAVYIANRPGKCEACKELIYRANKSISKLKREKTLRSVYVQKVDANKVFERDKWTCKQCDCKVQKVDIYKDNAAELDHIVPISLGGPHSYSNVQTLCRRCNKDKSNNYNGQLIMHI